MQNQRVHARTTYGKTINYSSLGQVTIPLFTLVVLSLYIFISVCLYTCIYIYIFVYVFVFSYPSHLKVTPRILF